VPTSVQPSSPLAPWLRGNAIFSSLSGVAVLTFRADLPRLLGVETGSLYVAVGAGLVLYGAHLWWLASRPVSRARALSIISGDVAWVLGSAVLLVSGRLTAAGSLIVAAAAVAVAVFAVGQWRASPESGRRSRNRRRTRRRASKHSG